MLFMCLQLVQGRHHVEGVEEGTRSCVDQSILAIFEDSTAASEVRVKAVHHSEASLGAARDCSLQTLEDNFPSVSKVDSAPLSW